VAECGRLGVAVLPADVNRSQTGFTFEKLPEGQLREYSNRLGIRFGLSAIRNVGEGPLSVILKQREQDGPFRSLEEFCDRVDRSALNKRVLESLIKCGAMDSLAGTRRQKLAILEQALSAGIESQRAREAGQSSMFDLFGGGSSGSGGSVQSIPLPAIPETPQDHKEQLAWEKELLGMYVSDHPIAKALEGLDTSGVTALGQISEEHVGQILTFVGMISQTRRLATKKGDSMLVATLEDLESSIELVAFPKSYEKYRELLKDDALLRVGAKVDKSRRDDTLQLLLENAEVLELSDPPAGSAEPPPQMDLEGVGEVEFSQAAPPFEYIGPVDSDSGSFAGDEPPHPAGPDSTLEPRPASPAAAPPEAEGPINIIRPRVKVGANGNGNGNGNVHSNGNGNGNGYTIAATPEPVASHSLRLYLPRTDDFDADVRLMQTVDRMLRQSSGEDPVIIHMPNAIGTVLLKPRHKVSCDAALLGGLRELLGSESVIVDR
jgi:DNA polymerase-3 subunit alpha